MLTLTGESSRAQGSLIFMSVCRDTTDSHEPEVRSRGLKTGYEEINLVCLPIVWEVVFLIYVDVFLICVVAVL